MKFLYSKKCYMIGGLIFSILILAVLIFLVFIVGAVHGEFLELRYDDSVNHNTEYDFIASTEEEITEKRSWGTLRTITIKRADLLTSINSFDVDDEHLVIHTGQAFTVIDLDTLLVHMFDMSNVRYRNPNISYIELNEDKIYSYSYDESDDIAYIDVYDMFGNVLIEFYLKDTAEYEKEFKENYANRKINKVTSLGEYETKSRHMNFIPTNGAKEVVFDKRVPHLLFISMKVGILCGAALWVPYYVKTAKGTKKTNEENKRKK